MKPKLKLVAAPSALATKTHCPYCAFQCGMTMRPRDGAVGVDVRADPDFPVNRGQMCIKGLNSAALLDHPGRVTNPLLRGRDGVLRTCTWDEALTFIATRMQEIKVRYGADANGAFGSGALTNEKAYLLGKFVRVALGSSQIDYNGRYCMASAAAGQNRAYGIDRGLPFPVSDIGETRALMLWGSNCACVTRSATRPHNRRTSSSRSSSGPKRKARSQTSRAASFCGAKPCPHPQAYAATSRF